MQVATALSSEFGIHEDDTPTQMPLDLVYRCGTPMHLSFGRPLGLSVKYRLFVVGCQAKRGCQKEVSSLHLVVSSISALSPVEPPRARCGGTTPGAPN